MSSQSPRLLVKHNRRSSARIESISVFSHSADTGTGFFFRGKGRGEDDAKNVVGLVVSDELLSSACVRPIKPTKIDFPPGKSKRKKKHPRSDILRGKRIDWIIRVSPSTHTTQAENVTARSCFSVQFCSGHRGRANFFSEQNPSCLQDANRITRIRRGEWFTAGTVRVRVPFSLSFYRFPCAGILSARRPCRFNVTTQRVRARARIRTFITNCI